MTTFFQLKGADNGDAPYPVHGKTTTGKSGVNTAASNAAARLVSTGKQ